MPRNDDVSDPALPLPPLLMWLITPHDKYSMAHLIEQHIEFVAGPEGGKWTVALPPRFVDHYLHYRDSTLPVGHLQ